MKQNLVVVSSNSSPEDILLRQGLCEIWLHKERSFLSIPMNIKCFLNFGQMFSLDVTNELNRDIVMRDL